MGVSHDMRIYICFGGRVGQVDVPKPTPPVAPEPYLGCASAYASAEVWRPKRVLACWSVMSSAT